jgi:DNA mismatch repair protein MutL
MPKVLVLPDHIASQIAAGEVVERPSSVVKELVENALDAGATEIEISISADCRDIRIADNGWGMDAQDAVLAFQRHATSKLTSADDLFSLSTLGFRGEAIPSIASISKFSCTTRTQEAATGTRVDTVNGELKATETGCAPGTVMEIQELFFNTPARLKFMKKASTEFGHIQETVQALAIGYPQTAFTLLYDGQTKLATSGQGNLAATIVEAGFFSGREPLVEVNASKSNTLNLFGYLAKPTFFRGDRKGILTLVNGRAVRCPLTYKALDYAYSDLIPRGRYPLAVVKLEVDPALVDVNIHPTKRELKYSQGNDIYLAIQRALVHALRQAAMETENFYPAAASEAETGEGNTESAQLSSSSSPSATQYGTPTKYQGTRGEAMSFAPLRESSTAYPLSSSSPQAEQLDEPAAPHLRNFTQNYSDYIDRAGQREERTEKENREQVEQISFKDSLSFSQRLDNPSSSSSAGSAWQFTENISNQSASSPAQISFEHLPEAGEIFLSPDREVYELPHDWRIMGYLHNTYIFVETNQGLEIIEQHIAHERTIYERLLQTQEIKGRLTELSQELFVSAPLNLSQSQLETLRVSEEALKKLGFEFTFSEEGLASVKSLPMELARINYVPMIQRLIDDLSQVENANLELEATKSIACQSAIKNGMPLSARDIIKLLSDWLTTQRNDTCPHGRPVKLKFSKDDLFQMFHPA